jgi:hypothetical protein
VSNRCGWQCGHVRCRPAWQTSVVSSSLRVRVLSPDLPLLRVLFVSAWRACAQPAPPCANMQLARMHAPEVTARVWKGPAATDFAVSPPTSVGNVNASVPPVPSCSAPVSKEPFECGKGHLTRRQKSPTAYLTCVPYMAAKHTVPGGRGACGREGSRHRQRAVWRGAGGRWCPSRPVALPCCLLSRAPTMLRQPGCCAAGAMLRAVRRARDSAEHVLLGHVLLGHAMRPRAWKRGREEESTIETERGGRRGGGRPGH